ncbi:hypothetical protein DNU06_04130 [Putridiphycobacter roseus]|uniref:TonB-dependent receptor plug domain-containing protein n=1 Tax=Putridiphycobacter roseus TaxID=2219161 RepID=A0A2W1NEF7_9FLAO|nr:TonB-dependent receptor [Putridiphycobacter roseus]PZE17815.1 hypothetical protein DNU06_04130 [Putridiphycobacter roseus]
MKNILLLFLFGLNFLAQAQDQESHILIVDENKQAIPNALIQINALGVSVLTNEAGVATLKKMANASYIVKVTHTGYHPLLGEYFIQADDTLRLELLLEHRVLDRVIVSSETGIQRENITSIQTVELASLSILKNESLGEKLAHLPGVDVTTLGPGINKTSIRGLSGSRVVTYVNSLRIQNQQWGSDHGLPITSLGIGDVSVVKGPASLLYGADALGGVLFFQDEKFVENNTQSFSFETGFNTNTMGTNSTGAYRFSKNKFKLNVYGNYSNHADYRLPNGNYLSNSRVNQVANKVVLGYNHKNWVAKFNYDFNRARIGLPGHSHDVATTAETYETSQQSRKINSPAQVIQNHYFSLEQKIFFKKSTFFFTLGHTINHLNEYEEKLLTPDIILHLNNSLYQFKWRFKIKDYAFFTFGSQGMLQQNKNGEFAVEYLIPDAITKDIGGYGLFNINYNNWRFQAGGRMDQRYISTTQTGDFTAFKDSYLGMNYAVGVAYLTKHLDLRLNGTSGFRAPSTSELLSSGIHHGSNRFEQGNIALETEKATQLDFNLATKFHDLEFTINPFFNLIYDFIYIQPTASVIDGYQVFEYTQAEYATLYGADFAIHFHPHSMHWIHFESNATLMYAQDQQLEALPLIPPFNIKNQIRFDLDMKTKFKIENIAIQHTYYAAQNRVSFIESKSKSYALYHLNFNFKFGNENQFSSSFNIQNIFNTAYIPHLSSLKSLGIYQPGRSFHISLKYEFNQVNK